MGRGLPFPSFGGFQGIFSPSNKFYGKKSLGAHVMKVSNDRKIHQQTCCLETRHACCIKGQGVSLGESLTYEAIISQNAGTVPEFSNFTFLSVLLLRQPFLGEYVELTIYISQFKIRIFSSLLVSISSFAEANEEINSQERVVCFSSFLLLGKRNNFLLMISGRAN